MNELEDSGPRITDTSGLEHLHKPRPARVGRQSTAGEQAVLYLRVSTQRQMHTAADIDPEGNSIATQREVTLERVRKMKLSVAQEFVEPGNSAQTIDKRPVFKEMLRYLDEHPEIGFVVIYMRSRVFRNFTDAAITKRILLQRGVRLISAREEFGEGYMADAMEAIVDVMNEVQVRQSGEDIKVKMRHKAERGGTVGRAKLGYLNARQSFEGRLVNTIAVDPERAPLIRHAFESYATGHYTLLSLLDELTVMGLTTRATSKWPEQPLSHSQISQILRDPYYTGVVPYKGELFPGRHEPIISKELFLRVQNVLNERARRGQRDIRHHHYLKGMLYCDRCVKAGRRGRLVFTENRGNGGTYGYYICVARQSRECDLPNLPIAEVERAAARAFAKEKLRPDFLAGLRTRVSETVANAKASEVEVRASLAAQIRKLDVREERLLDLASDGELNTSKLKQRLQTVKLERDGLRERLTRTDESIARGAKTIGTYLDLLSDPGQLYDRAPDDIRRQLLDAFYEGIALDIEFEVTAKAERRASVAELHDAEISFGQVTIESPEGPNNHKSPRLSTRAPAVTSLGLLTQNFFGPGVSKTNLVAGTGFEPATSGL